MRFTRDEASAAAVESLLIECDRDYVPSLSSRVSLGEYASKIVARAVRFEAWDEQKLVGLVAAYCNEQTRTAFVTNVSVELRFRGAGVGSQLMDACIASCRKCSMTKIELQVHHASVAAIALYRRHGFEFGNRSGDEIQMVHVVSETSQTSISTDGRPCGT